MAPDYNQSRAASLAYRTISSSFQTSKPLPELAELFRTTSGSEKPVVKHPGVHNVPSPTPQPETSALPAPINATGLRAPSVFNWADEADDFGAPSVPAISGAKAAVASKSAVPGSKRTFTLSRAPSTFNWSDEDEDLAISSLAITPGAIDNTEKPPGAVYKALRGNPLRPALQPKRFLSFSSIQEEDEPPFPISKDRSISLSRSVSATLEAPPIHRPRTRPFPRAILPSISESTPPNPFAPTHHEEDSDSDSSESITYARKQPSSSEPEDAGFRASSASSTEPSFTSSTSSSSSGTHPITKVTGYEHLGPHYTTHLYTHLGIDDDREYSPGTPKGDRLALLINETEAITLYHAFNAQCREDFSDAFEIHLASEIQTGRLLYAREHPADPVPRDLREITAYEWGCWGLDDAAVTRKLEYDPDRVRSFLDGELGINYPEAGNALVFVHLRRVFATKSDRISFMASWLPIIEFTYGLSVDDLEKQAGTLEEALNSPTYCRMRDLWASCIVHTALDWLQWKEGEARTASKFAKTFLPE